MFTSADLSALLSAAAPVGVSVFLPTHARGAQVRQGPIRLKNLIAQARVRLLAAGRSPGEVEAFLAPATELVADHQFWQHQAHGLALFLDGSRARPYRVPIALDEAVVVGPGFHIRPLLPLLAADGPFHVLTITEDRVRLFHASRFSMVEDEAAELPHRLSEDRWDSDYENPVQASPVARPHTGPVSISNAQVYGDSPPEWRKSRLVEFTRRVAAGVERHVAARPAPVVLVANPETAGHFQKFTTLGPQLLGVLEVDPEALDGPKLHDAAYAAVWPHFDAGRREAAQRLLVLLGGPEARAVTALDDVVRSAYQGRVETLVLVEEGAVWGHYDEATDRVTVSDDGAGEDLLNTVAVQTLRHGGAVHLAAREEMPGSAAAAAILRY